MSTDVVVTYQAREQFGRLSSQDQASLRRVLGDPSAPGTTKQADSPERFVSKFGRGMRVHWKRADDGKVVVLSVVAA